MMKVKDWPQDIEIQESHRQKSDVTSDETSFFVLFSVLQIWSYK